MSSLDRLGSLFMPRRRSGKKGPAPRKERSAGVEGWARKPMMMNLRGSPEFKQWVQELADYDRETAAGVIERALVHYAKAIGFAKIAPQR